MKKTIFWLAVLVFAVMSTSESHAQGRGSAFAAVPVPGQPVPAIPTPPTPTPVAPQPTGIPRPASPTAPQAAAPGAKPEEQLRIVPDQATNSLIIYSTVQEFQNIKNILKDLDIIPRQVLMDVLVAEVTLADTSSFGVEYELFKLQNPTIFGQTFNSQAALRNFGVPGTGFSSITGQTATALAQFGAGASGVIGRGNSVQAFITALATDSRVKVLSSPTVLATDNKPARIQVGNEIPVLTGQTSTFTTGSAPLTSNAIQYRNTGVILTIIPQVNSQGLVHLQVKQEVSDVGQDNFGSTGSPSFSTRDAETTAVVQDGETLAIGGLISEKKQRARSGIPYLMDLPVVGRFFATTRDTSDRTELVMLITPHVVRSREESRDVTEEFKSRLSNVKTELERLNRERARERTRELSQPDDSRLDRKPTLPPVAPVVPTPPNPPTPVPSPSRAPVVPVPPLSPASAPVVPAPQVLLAPKSRSSQELVDEILTQSQGGSAFNAAMQPERIAAAPAVEPSALPSALLSTPRITITPEPPIQTQPQRQKTSPVWLVQVGSYAREKDAMLFASKLRSRGYDVDVVNAEVAGRTWSRVQVGHLATQKDARELQRSLRVNEKIEQSLVAVSH